MKKMRKMRKRMLSWTLSILIALGMFGQGFSARLVYAEEVQNPDGVPEDEGLAEEQGQEHNHDHDGTHFNDDGTPIEDSGDDDQGGGNEDIPECKESTDGKHHPGDWEVTVEARCYEKGRKVRACQYCRKELEAEEIPMTDHKPVLVQGHSATETETGLTDGKVCQMCNKELEPQKTIPALGKPEEPGTGGTENPDAGEGKPGEKENPDAGEEKPGEKENPDAGEEKPGEKENPDAGEGKPGEKENPDAGEEKPGEKENPDVGEEKPGEKENPDAGEEKPGEKENPDAGETKPDEKANPDQKITEPEQKESEKQQEGKPEEEKKEEAKQAEPQEEKAEETEEKETEEEEENEEKENEEKENEEKNHPCTHAGTNVTDEPVAATCTHTGLTSGSHCTSCGKILIEQRETPKLPHSPISAKSLDPNASALKMVCAVCRADLTDNTWNGLPIENFQPVNPDGSDGLHIALSGTNAEVYTHRIGGDPGVAVTQDIYCLMDDSLGGTNGSRIELKSHSEPISGLTIVPLMNPTAGLVEYNIGNNEAGLDSLSVDLTQNGIIRVQENGEDAALRLMGIQRDASGIDQAILGTESGGQLIFSSSRIVFTRQETAPAADGSEIVISPETPVYTRGAGPNLSAAAPGGAERKTYTVTYRPGQYGSGAEQTTVKKELQTLILADALYTREGYIQNGWTREDGGGKEVDLGTPYEMDADLTLYPSWEEKKPDTFEVKFAAGKDGKGPEQTLMKTEGEALFLPDALFTRDEYLQIGWTKTEGGNYTYDLKGKYTEDQAVVLYPVWAPRKIEIVFSVRTIEDKPAEDTTIAELKDDAATAITEGSAGSEQEVFIIIPFKDPETSTSFVDTIQDPDKDEKKTIVKTGFRKDNVNPDGTVMTGDDDLTYCYGDESMGRHKWRNKNGHCSCKKCGKTLEHNLIRDLQCQCTRCGDAEKCKNFTDVYDYVESIGSMEGVTKLNRRCGVCGTVCGHTGRCKKVDEFKHRCSLCKAENRHSWLMKMENNRLVVRIDKKNQMECAICGYKMKLKKK